MTSYTDHMAYIRKNIITDTMTVVEKINSGKIPAMVAVHASPVIFMAREFFKYDNRLKELYDMFSDNMVSFVRAPTVTQVCMQSDADPYTITYHGTNDLISSVIHEAVNGAVLDDVEALFSDEMEELPHEWDAEAPVVARRRAAALAAIEDMYGSVRHYGECVGESHAMYALLYYDMGLSSLEMLLAGLCDAQGDAQSCYQDKIDKLGAISVMTNLLKWEWTDMYQYGVSWDGESYESYVRNMTPPEILADDISPYLAVIQPELWAHARQMLLANTQDQWDLAAGETAKRLDAWVAAWHRAPVWGTPSPMETFIPAFAYLYVEAYPACHRFTRPTKGALGYIVGFGV